MKLAVFLSVLTFLTLVVGSAEGHPPAHPMIKHGHHQVATTKLVALDGSRIKPTFIRQVIFKEGPRNRRRKRQFMPNMSDSRSMGMSHTIQGPGGMSMSGSMSQAMSMGHGGMSGANAGAMAMSGMGMSQAMANANAMSMG